MSKSTPSAPYARESKPLMHLAYLRGRADCRAGRPPRKRETMAPTAALAYYHGYRGDKWRRLPGGQLVWLGR